MITFVSFKMADNIASGVPATSNNSHRFLDTVFARESPLTEEQFSFIIHHADQGRVLQTFSNFSITLGQSRKTSSLYRNDLIHTS
jgi:hypothetical protein